MHEFSLTCTDDNIIITLRVLPIYTTIWSGINANFSATFDLGICIVFNGKLSYFPRFS